MSEAKRNQKARQDDSTITPQSSTKHNVEQAVQRSRGNRSSTINSEQQLSKVKEAEEDYCDQTGARTNLAFAGEDSATKIQVRPSSPRRPSVFELTFPFLSSDLRRQVHLQPQSSSRGEG